VQVGQAVSIAAPAVGEYVTLRLEVSGTGPVYLFGGQITAGGELQQYTPNPLVIMDRRCELVSWTDPFTGEMREGYFPTDALLAENLRERFRIKCVGAPGAVPTTDFSICGSSEEVEYLETDFAINLEEIRSGNLLGQGQFQVGNYNYRLIDVGVNLVGAGVKDCDSVPTAGPACEANLFIPFDLSHGGAVSITNHAQQEIPFVLGTGWIRSAKALAAGDVLLTPLTSAQGTALTPLLKSELRGRPVQGNYLLRIHNVPGLVWSALEDVQLYVKYRYWSSIEAP
jgi:hypothetical protein